MQWHSGIRVPTVDAGAAWGVIFWGVWASAPTHRRGERIVGSESLLRSVAWCPKAPSGCGARQLFGHTQRQGRHRQPGTLAMVRRSAFYTPEHAAKGDWLGGILSQLHAVLVTPHLSFNARPALHGLHQVQPFKSNAVSNSLRGKDSEVVLNRLCRVMR